MPAKHAKDLQHTYAQVAQGYESKNAENLDVVNLQRFVKKVPTNGRILDLGCGHGRDSRWFADQGFDVTMFDLSSDMLAIAQRKVPEAIVVQGDMTEMQFRPESFDGVWASASILHLTKEEAKRVIREVFRILKSGGTFYCLLKKGEGEAHVTDDKYGIPMSRYFAFYSPDEVRQLFEKEEFRNVEVWSSQSGSGQAWVEAMGYKN